jgi:hypothetical protein
VAVGGSANGARGAYLVFPRSGPILPLITSVPWAPPPCTATIALVVGSATGAGLHTPCARPGRRLDASLRDAGAACRSELPSAARPARAPDRCLIAPLGANRPLAAPAVPDREQGQHAFGRQPQRWD